jgi:23S rRNA pseudouridine2605 synthase
MAKRHEDRKPGQRFARAGKATAKKTSSKKSAGKVATTRKATSSSGVKSAAKGPRSGSARPLRKAPAKRAPLRGSKRRADGLVVTPSKVLGSGPSATKDGKVRLNHFLAKSGICSRRNADELISAGRVEVNGDIVTELGVRVDPTDDDVRFDGVRLEPERAVYVLLNKPKGVVCTNARHEQKKRVVDLLPTIRGRIFTVGRLDMDSEGLLMITNDGAFAQEMTHPRYGVSKLYSVIVRGRIEDQDLTKARGGVWLSEGPTAGMELKVERLAKERTFLKVTLREGKNREIRRVFAKLGHPVISLKRVRIGNLSLHGLSDGDWRFLKIDEVAKLRDIAREERSQKDAAAGQANAFAERSPRSRSGGSSVRKAAPRPASPSARTRAASSRPSSGGRGKPSTRKAASKNTRRR